MVKLVSAGALFALFGGLSEVSQATGFFVPQQAAPGAARANSGGVAAASDASTIFFNPAGMTRLPGSEVLVGASIIYPKVDFADQGSSVSGPATAGSVALSGNDGGNPGGASPAGSFFYSRELTDDKLWLGFALTGPFGQKFKYRSDWFARYDSIESELITLDFAPSVAYRFDGVSLGAGLDFQYADARLTSAVPNTLVGGSFTPATDGLSEVDGDDWSVGFNVGLLFEPRSAPGTRIGLHYRSRMKHRMEGRLKVTGLSGPLAGVNTDTPMSVELNLPDVFSAGIAHELTNGKTTLFGEVQWFGWSVYDELRIKTAGPDLVSEQGYRDTYTVSGAVEHELNSKWLLRGGVQLDRTPTVDEFRNTSVPDADRLWLAGGFSYRLSPTSSIDTALIHVLFDDPRLDLTRTFYDGTPAAGSVRIKADATESVTTLAVAYRYRF